MIAFNTNYLRGGKFSTGNLVEEIKPVVGENKECENKNLTNFLAIWHSTTTMNPRKRAKYIFFETLLLHQKQKLLKSDLEAKTKSAVIEKNELEYR